MCIDMYIKYSCGCLGRFLGKNHCREDLDTTALLERGMWGTDYRIIINNSLYDQNSDVGYNYITRKCYKCRKAEKK